MTCDYEAIREDNKREYGAGIGRFGRPLLTDRYDDRTHFIYELLQNAEDALGRRSDWYDSRTVAFELTATTVRVSHFGQPFNEQDVRGICGIGESTKDLTAIGRFGIGFKSVFAFSDRPEVHSGQEAFAIENFVWPVATDPIDRDAEETVLLIPLRPADDKAREEITEGLSRLGASALLFLHHTEEIRWEVSTGQSGNYLREAEEIAPGIRRVTVIGQEDGKPEVDEDWLVFSRPVTTTDGTVAGQVEVAWSMTSHNQASNMRLRPINSSPLVVFFPTIVPTHLGFLVQGPYRTTPSRDNVPPRDDWNRHCVDATAKLLVDALRWLRDQGTLDVAGLQCLPMEEARFPDDAMFRPMYDATRRALTDEELLPAFGGGYVCATKSKLARTQDLRELLDPAKLTALYGDESPIRWLSDDISQDRTPELRRYLMRELDVDEVTPEALLPNLEKQFLAAQPDAWIERLYCFLDSQPALRRRAATLPIIRLADGSHVPPFVDGQPQAFLPGQVESGFPTVRASVCQSETARTFLESLGLTTPDPVDDVIRNVLPKYHNTDSDIGEAEYTADVRRFLEASRTDSKAQRERLIDALREAPWVMSMDAGNGTELRTRPADTYLATERLTQLFAGIDGISLVNSRFHCLRGEEARQLLEASGASRYLQPIKTECDLSSDDLRKIRREGGLEASTWGAPSDVTLRGIEDVLEVLPTLDAGEQHRRAQCLWRALGDVYERRGTSAFDATYTWGYSRETKTASFDAAFVRLLQTTEWIPDHGGGLQPPSFVVFDTLGWPPNPYLESTIRFKPPIIDQLARQAGIEAGALDLLKKLGITSEADLRERLGVSESDLPQQPDADREPAAVEAPSTPASPASAPGTDAQTEDVPSERPTTDGATHPSTLGGTDSGNLPASRSKGDHPSDGTPRHTREEPPASTDPRRFVSYVTTHPDADLSDPDGLDHAARMKVEADAIEFILRHEPEWQRTEINNPGFDLYQGSTPQSATRWCEVKAMTGTLLDRPVGLSRTQFEYARNRGVDYWLYVVEQAGTPAASLVRIQDPVGKAATFTFDHGWRVVAEAAP